MGTPLPETEVCSSNNSSTSSANHKTAITQLFNGVDQPSSQIANSVSCLPGLPDETKINETMSWLLQEGVSISDLLGVLDLQCPVSNDPQGVQEQRDTGFTASNDDTFMENFDEELISLLCGQTAFNEESTTRLAPSEEGWSNPDDESLSDIEPIPFLSSEPFQIPTSYCLDDLFADTDM